MGTGVSKPLSVVFFFNVPASQSVTFMSPSEVAQRLAVAAVGQRPDIGPMTDDICRLSRGEIEEADRLAFAARRQGFAVRRNRHSGDGIGAFVDLEATERFVEFVLSDRDRPKQSGRQ